MGSAGFTLVDASFDQHFHLECAKVLLVCPLNYNLLLEASIAHKRSALTPPLHTPRGIHATVLLSFRCSWAGMSGSKEYLDYHDTEWGVPTHDDRQLFELITLEGAQVQSCLPVPD